MAQGLLGAILTPAQGNLLPDGVEWCADNGCFGKGYPGDEAWLAWLGGYNDEQRGRCAFAVAPDVVSDAEATLERSLPFLPAIREMGYPAAYVAQNGATPDNLPWDEFDVVFIGGDTDWKLSHIARSIGVRARQLGKGVHVGRVNSYRRLLHIDSWADSCDGTYIAFGPDINLPKMLGNLRALDWQRQFEQLGMLG